ncbi:uncharacterized membrane-anchored protein YjiN (DUF445 family) [Halopolyspora algeriensis]|uniref:Uncharacterized membrane-anchored protein YjiN (DUF445 family) n=1 Tax=Halopolyspora algeriensis TaxID=1500506 RepID=A0A368VY95_9ACTN|nr:DUF445 domain-containing protein [Halopolyspora algeriensis]RCW46931.1 uncharacterized membrane-anchored protein YjiN (DUF445 family) [Halopolyspora algeriensis]
MKGIATGLLLLAVAIYVVTRWQESIGAPAWVGYVNAAAEAGMVGALADWFAVTALFRHPLGLPIPHTAIIPTRKNVLGHSLGDFVGTNFLSEQVVRDKLHRAEITRRVGSWLDDPEHAERVTAELATAVRGAVQVLRDEDVQEVFEQTLVRKVLDRPWAPPLGRILGRVFADGSHHNLVDLVCDRAYDWIRDNHETVLRVVSQRAPSWSPRFFDSLVADKVYAEVLSFAWAVKTDPDHQMRKAVDRFLVEFADDLQHDPKTMATAERIKQQVLEHPEVRALISSAWSTAKTMLLDAAEDPAGELRVRVRDGLRSMGRRLAEEASLRAKVDGWLEGAAVYVVSHYRSEITTLITDTVERWDAEETSRKIESHVGRDLQFIRINGTVVGALAGLVIHTASQLLW